MEESLAVDVRHAGQFLQELPVILLIRCAFPGLTGGMDARPPVQRFYHQAGIVGQGPFPRVEGDGLRLLDGILMESGPVFNDLRGVRIVPQRKDLDSRPAENRAYLGRLAPVF
jgi:hypothetical protein